MWGNIAIAFLLAFIVSFVATPYTIKIANKIGAVHSVLEKTPPELSADISDRGIYMTGGGCLIDGLDRLLQEKTGINVMIADDAVSCVALGTGKALDNLDNLERK